MSKRKRRRTVTGIFLVGVLVVVAATTTFSFRSLWVEAPPAGSVAEAEIPLAAPLAPATAVEEDGVTSAVAARPAAAEPAALDGTRPAPGLPAPPQPPPVANYIVLPGDTLLALAQRYKTTAEQMLAINPGLAPERLRAGEIIKVPDRASAEGRLRPHYVWPADGPITTPFGEPGSSWIGGYHMGLDIGGSTGDVVWAAEEGIIVDTGTNGRNHGYGTYILMYHFQGWYTLYAHLSAVYRDIGYVARKGEPIGEVGSTGFADGPHLHFEVWQGEEKLDPIQFLP